MLITARQLAEELLKNPDDIVCSVSYNFELNGSAVPKTSLHLTRYKGDLRKERFRDVFDGESYSKEVVKYDNEGPKSFVQL
jgi:hypothetical protein